MGITIKLEGSQEAIRKIRFYQFNKKAEAKALIAETLYAIEGDAKRFVRVDQGFLRSSIAVELRKDGLGGAVGTNLEYAAAQEFGKPSQPNYGYTPYLFPAYEMHRKPFLESLKKILAKAF